MRVLKGDDGHVAGLECVRMELGEPDESGRRRPLPVAGSEFVLECDTLIPAIGQSVDLSWRNGDGVDVARGGTVEADPDTFMTARQGVFAGGDAVRGPATLVEAIGDGQRAAFAIERYLTGQSTRAETLDEVQRLRSVPRAAPLGGEGGSGDDAAGDAAARARGRARQELRRGGAVHHRRAGAVRGGALPALRPGALTRSPAPGRRRRPLPQPTQGWPVVCRNLHRSARLDMFRRGVSK